MRLLTKIRHRIGKWCWKENDWTKAVDSIEAAAKILQNKERRVVWRIWRFAFMDPPVVLKVRIELADKEEPDHNP
jgi:hypothetical protein